MWHTNSNGDVLTFDLGVKVIDDDLQLSEVHVVQHGGRQKQNLLVTQTRDTNLSHAHIGCYSSKQHNTVRVTIWQ